MMPSIKNEKILPRVAVVADMSGFGKVSLTEALPIISAMGIEACPLPTALLSTHTYEFKNYTLLDLTDEMERIIKHWEALSLEFDAVYSGYMSSSRQIEITLDFMCSQKQKGAIIVVDPVLGDNSLLDVKSVYSDRMTELIDGMRDMCRVADTITPNLTEACLLLNCEYPNAPLSDEEIKALLLRLAELGPKSVAITSVMDQSDSMCVAVYDSTKNRFCKIDCGYVDRIFHGTGDIYTSVCTGALVLGKDIIEAASLSADFVANAISYTMKYPQIPIRHGVLFEPVIASGYFAKQMHSPKITEI